MADQKARDKAAPGTAQPNADAVAKATAPGPGEGAARGVKAQADIVAKAGTDRPGDAVQAPGGDDARKDLVTGLSTPVGSQFGTHPGVAAEADAVRQQNNATDLAGGSYATTALAAPLTANDQVGQVVPALGDPRTSTNPVAANASHQPIAGEQHLALVGEDGNDIAPNALFTDPGGDTTYVLAAQRVYERFVYPNANEASTRLLYPAGARVPKAQAAAITTTLHRQAAFSS